MWDIKTIVSDFINTKDLQEFINHRYKSKGDMFTRDCDKNTFKYIGTDYAMFYLDSMSTTIEGANVDYNMDDLKPTDIVLDIGACIGGFALKAARKADKIYAVEPTFFNELKKNIELNNFKNISVLPYALGKYQIELDFINKKVNQIKNSHIKSKTLSEFIEMCGGHIDFLKIDCEGGEWYIKPGELKSIRCIEAEIHHFKGMPEFDEFENTLKTAGFGYEKEIINKELMLIHARQL